MTSLPPLRRMLTPNSIVLGEPTKSIAAAAPPPVASITCFTASGAALSMVATAPIWRACARFCASMSATITLPSIAAGAARADDHQMVVSTQMPARLFERRESRDARAGVSRGEPLRYALVRQQVAAARHDHMGGIAAGAPRAERARAQAEQFLALPTHRAFAAANPWVGHHLVANFYTRGVRAECRHLTRDLVPHRER